MVCRRGSWNECEMVKVCPRGANNNHVGPMGFLLILHSACSLAETGIEFRKASGIIIFVAKSFYFLADFY